MTTTTHYAVSRDAERLNMLTNDTRNSMWSWPGKAEVVKINVPETEYERYECWKAVGAGRVTRQLRADSIPFDVRKLLPESVRRFNSSIQGHFSLHWALGQEDDWRTRNMIVAIGPLWKYPQGGLGEREVAWPGLRVEIGCAHDYETLASGNCYRKARCRKCSHTWACDSGD